MLWNQTIWGFNLLNSVTRGKFSRLLKLCLLVFKMVLKGRLLTCKRAYRWEAADSTLTCCQELVWARRCAQSRWEMPCIVLSKGAILEPQPEGPQRNLTGRLLSLFTPMRRHPSCTLTRHSLRVSPQNRFKEKNILTYILQLNLVSGLRWLFLAQPSTCDAEETCL